MLCCENPSRYAVKYVLSKERGKIQLGGSSKEYANPFGLRLDFRLTIVHRTHGSFYTLHRECDVGRSFGFRQLAILIAVVAVDLSPG